MTKLEKLYSIIENSKEVGVELNKDVLPLVDELEESIIRDEILPSLINDVEPCLKPIQRDLALIVEYHPGDPIRIAISRKTKISTIDDAKTLTTCSSTSVMNVAQPNMVVNTSDAILITSSNIQEAQSRDLRITVNGKVFQEKNAIQTFIEALKYIGLDEVSKVGIMCSGYNLVDTRQRIDGNRKWQQREGDKWIYIYFSNTTKVKFLMQIAETLKLDIKIEAL